MESKEWEPITYHIVQVGDIVGQKQYPQYEYQVEDIVYEAGNLCYRVSYKGRQPTLHSQSVFNVIKPTTTQYDPKQQPYEDTDI